MKKSSLYKEFTSLEDASDNGKEKKLIARRRERQNKRVLKLIETGLEHAKSKDTSALRKHILRNGIGRDTSFVDKEYAHLLERIQDKIDLTEAIQTLAQIDRNTEGKVYPVPTIESYNTSHFEKNRIIGTRDSRQIYEEVMKKMKFLFMLCGRQNLVDKESEVKASGGFRGDGRYKVDYKGIPVSSPGLLGKPSLPFISSGQSGKFNKKVCALLHLSKKFPIDDFFHVGSTELTKEELVKIRTTQESLPYRTGEFIYYQEYFNKGMYDEGKRQTSALEKPSRMVVAFSVTSEETTKGESLVGIYIYNHPQAILKFLEFWINSNIGGEQKNAVSQRIAHMFPEISL